MSVLMKIKSLFKDDEVKAFPTLEERLQFAMDDSESAMSVFHDIKHDLTLVNNEIKEISEELTQEVDALRKEYETKVARFDKLDVNLSNTHSKNEVRINRIKVALGEDVETLE